MTLADILQQRAGEVIQVTPDIPVRTVIALLADHRIGAVPVVEDGAVIGIMSERDVLMKIVARDIKYDTNVMEVASRIPVTLTDRETIARAVKIMIADGAEYIAICLPAFSPDSVHRDA